MNKHLHTALRWKTHVNIGATLGLLAWLASEIVSRGGF